MNRELLKIRRTIDIAIPLLTENAVRYNDVRKAQEILLDLARFLDKKIVEKKEE